jgi:hypothetical protein
MNEAEEITKVITENIRRSRVLIREAERATVEMTEPYKVRIINSLIDIETRLNVLSDAIITGDIKDDLKWKAAVFAISTTRRIKDDGL